MSDGGLKVEDLHEKQLAELGPCAKCGKKLLEGARSGLTPFYVIDVRQALTDPHALRRRVGLEMQIGQLASVMGPDEALAKVLPGTRFMLHQDCALHLYELMELVERVNERSKGAESGEGAKTE